MIVMKFGGTSLGDADRIKIACEIVRSRSDKKPVVVVSAVSKVTDSLIELANGKDNLKQIKKKHLEIIDKLGIEKDVLDNDFKELEEPTKLDLDAKKIDLIQSFGERMSSKLLAACLNKHGLKAKAFNAWDLGFVTDNNHGCADILDKTYSTLKKSIEKLDVVAVVTGFIGKNELGDITTLGRGGSDYTAAIIGNSIDAEEVQIWTDVDGIMSADPKVVKDAKLIGRVSFAEASELSYFGAKVLHPKTMLPAMRKNIPVRVLNTLNPSGNGTLITRESVANGQTVKAISFKKGISIINIRSTRMLGAHGFLAKIFEIFEKYRKSVDVIATSEVAVSLTVDNGEQMDGLVKDLKEFSHVNLSNNKSIICVVGEENRKNPPGTVGRTFSTLGKNNINIEMISLGASRINMTFIVDGKDTEKTVKSLHEEYFK